jgi:hypothetical protein
MLAKCFLAGEPAIEPIVARTGRMLGKRWRWLRPLAQRYIKASTGQTRPRQREVVRFLLQDRGFRRILSKHTHELFVEQWLSEPQRMQPVGAAEAWDVPAVESTGALAKWLGVKVGELQWFADLKGLGYRKSSPRLKHYHYRILAKANGSIRLIESPKLRLKALQRQILTEILGKIPVHPATHGFVKGRSIKTGPARFLSFVPRRTGADFFSNAGVSRIGC